MAQLMRSTEETVATEMALDLQVSAKKQHPEHTPCLVLLLKLLMRLSSARQNEASVFMAHPLGGLGGECLWRFSMLIGMN